MMRILMAARWPVGGIRTFFRYIYSQPVFDDCQVTLVAPGEGLAEFLHQDIPSYRFHIEQCEDSTGATMRALLRVSQKTKHDLVHAHGLTTGVIAVATRFGRRTPYLMTVHDVFLPTMFTGAIGRLKKVGLNLLLGRLDAVHAVGEDCAENFRQFMPDVLPNRIFPILNGIDTERFASASPEDIHSAYGLDRRTALVGFFGRFMAQKGFRTLVDAVEILVARQGHRPFRVVTFGWGGFVREDFEYVRDKGLERYFIQQRHTDCPERWMKGLDVIAMPSRWEACGLVAMEALAAGVPIVATSCIGLREVLAGSPAKMVPVGDRHSLANALADEMESNRRSVFEKYKSVAARRYSVTLAARAIRSLYDDLASNLARVEPK